MGVLDGKVAMVTGAGRLRGIGRATAVALAAQGADVVETGTGRDPATFPADEKAVNWNDVHSTVEQIEARGRRGLALIGARLPPGFGAPWRQAYAADSGTVYPRSRHSCPRVDSRRASV